MKYVIGIITIIIGAFLVIKTDIVMSWFGRVGFAEKHFSTEGGSRLFYKLLGLVMIFLALIGMIGLLGFIIKDLFGPLFSSLNN
ncbi:MAG: hypothetical protein V1853_05470 [bacterium]